VEWSKQGSRYPARGVSRVTKPATYRLPLAGVLLVAVAVGMAGCSPTTMRHGHHFQESDIQQVQPGMSQSAVRLALGTPDTTSTVSGGQAYYYISSTTQQTAFMKPTETDRKVLAVYFNPGGTVERVAQYGKKDGKIFDYVKRETPSQARDSGLIGQILRGIGPVSPFGG
jgi:outer membrane protein assembly factor BamE (lipoprotein component of BamABCDE complex)